MEAASAPTVRLSQFPPIHHRPRTWIEARARHFDLRVPEALASEQAMLAKVAELLELLGEIAFANQTRSDVAPAIAARLAAGADTARPSVSWYPYGMVEVRDHAVALLGYLVDHDYVRCQGESYDCGARRVRWLVVAGQPLTVVEIENIVLAHD